MIINNLKMPVEHSKEDLFKSILNECENVPTDYKVLKKSIDARRGNVEFVYKIQLTFNNENYIEEGLEVPQAVLDERPIVIGSGPAGLFAGYILAKAGLKPVIFERGNKVEERTKKIETFFNGGKLDTETNIQFGEGGAGTFSDGKLTTQISNPLCREVLNIFSECGAPEEILYLAKPHIGTDILRKVIINFRNKIIELGGEFIFNTKVTDIVYKNNKIEKIVADKEYYTNNVVLAIGHSARDTFLMLYEKGIKMLTKPFSVGARIEHIQKELDKCQYGKYAGLKELGAADYKLSTHLKNGRGVYTFCMCPGGVVVAAASENNSIVTNGMSYHSRNGVNSNSALLVGVTPGDFKSEHPLSGIEFQRELERKAFEISGGAYKAPAQTVGDFINKQKTVSFGKVSPSYMPGVKGSNLWNIFPEYISQSMVDGINDMSQKLEIFRDKDAVLTGVETRSSSPVKILRDENFESNIKGLYPCGEGAGYAGGIMSAAVDGIRCALAIIERNLK